MPRKFDGTDVKKFTLWTFEIRNYVGNQLGAFRDCQAIKLVFLSSLTGTASAYANRFMPELFSEDDKTEEAKRRALDSMINFLAGRYTDFIAQQRARRPWTTTRRKNPKNSKRGISRTTNSLTKPDTSTKITGTHNTSNIYIVASDGTPNNHDIKKIRMQTIDYTTISACVRAMGSQPQERRRENGWRNPDPRPSKGR
ncbi:hypothetical protein BDD12DRAFT_876788 [Trichophaea hybrida]|nr:hypothetical protein BDD12DRAFT_876788 [Trichophaea hybrida]